jgi:hypothetical protein
LRRGFSTFTSNDGPRDAAETLAVGRFSGRDLSTTKQASSVRAMMMSDFLSISLNRDA